MILAIGPTQADVTGKITLLGQPGSVDESFFAKANGCGESPIRHTGNWKVGKNGELADVVVWIVDPKFATDHPVTAPPEIEIKQIGCRYFPHVVALQAGVPFKVINGDATLHNVRAKVYDGPGKPPGATIFNFGQSYQGQSDDRKLDAAGVFMLQCDVHNWMQCWVRVLPNSCFGVSADDGTFKLQTSENLEDGTYKVLAWHPRFPDIAEQTVAVKNGVGTVNFQLDGAKSF